MAEVKKLGPKDTEMVESAKVGLAVEFINKIRSMQHAELSAYIKTEAGEQLSRYFLQYSMTLLDSKIRSGDIDTIFEAVASLMLMGYMVRVNEEKNSEIMKNLPMVSGH